MIETDVNRNVLYDCLRLHTTECGHHSTDPYFGKDKFTRGVFQGVYPSDKLPASVSQFPALLIANVDTNDKPGSHWVAFYFTKEQEGEFFDSYGSPPSKYSGTFTTFLNNSSNQRSFNTMTLQSIYSKVCRHYCLYFALYRSRQLSKSTIVHCFSIKRT